MVRFHFLSVEVAALFFRGAVHFDGKDGRQALEKDHKYITLDEHATTKQRPHE